MDIKESFKNKLQTLREELPGVMRRSNKTLDPDLRNKFKDYKTDQQNKHSSNNTKTSWMMSSNPTYKMMGQMKPWQSTDSKAKYDATRDKVVDKQNQREIRREPPITVKEENLNELRGKSSLSDDERKELKDRIRKKHGKAWDDTIGIRKEKKSSGPADTRDMDKLRNRLAKMYNNLEEEQLDEISPGRANDAYHTAAEKGKTADIMTGLTKSKKWKNIADKRWSQARKFADYSDKKK